MKYQILYNPKSNNGRGSEEAENAIGRLNEKKKPGAEIVRKDITSIDIKRYIQNETAADDIIVICGGDGTLSRFINDTDGMEINRRIDYYATGTGNDFFRDLGLEKGDIAENVGKYITNLPKVTVCCLYRVRRLFWAIIFTTPFVTSLVWQLAL